MKSKRMAVRVMAGAVAVLGVLAPVTATADTSLPSTPGAAAESATLLAQQLRQGTLTSSHGVRQLCADQKLACLAQVITTATGSAQPLSTGEPVGYGATELEQVYNLGQDQGTGTIAIIDAGAYPNLESDLATYREQYGLPPCTSENGCFSQLNLNGGPALAPDPANAFAEESVAVETALDMDMASAACPGCKLMEIQVPILDAFLQSDDPFAHKATADFGTAVKTAVQHGADAVSMSYGYPSDATNDNGPGQDLNQPGVAVVASSGDSGFNVPNDFGQPWPQNLPWVTSAGGTSLYPPTADRPGYTEIAWSEAGSGCDTTLAPAVGQPDSVSAQCGGHRAGSDISAVADPATGLAVYDTYAPSSGVPGNWFTVGGTSASSPLIAGMYARAGHNPDVNGPNTLYGKPSSAFNDITLGQNAANGVCQQVGFAQQVCAAGPGWDGPSGLGSPNGLAAFS